MTKMHLFPALAATAALVAGGAGFAYPAAAATAKGQAAAPRTAVACAAALGPLGRVQLRVRVSGSFQVARPALAKVGAGLALTPAEVARVLDMSVKRLRKEGEGGRTVAQIAAKEHMSRSAFVAALARIARAKLRSAVKAGSLSAAAANKALRAVQALGGHLWSMKVSAPLFALALPMPPFAPPKGAAKATLAGGPPFAALAGGPCALPAVLALAEAAVTPSDVAEALGVSLAQLRKASAAGITVAAVAEAHGLDRARFFARLEAIVDAQLKKDVAAGRISASQANSLLSTLKRGWSILWTQTATPATVRVGAAKG